MAVVLEKQGILSGMVQKERYALLSVSDKTDLYEFAKGLQALGFTLVASQGTAHYLRSHRIPVVDVEDITGIPPLIGERGIKSIHHIIFAGILADPNNAEHRMDMINFGVHPFEIVACNFYPFEDAVKRKAPHAEIIDLIDIGGPAMVRCAAKNSKNVIVIVNPRKYAQVLQELRDSNKVFDWTRERLAIEAFVYTHKYDQSIIEYLMRQ